MENVKESLYTLLGLRPDATQDEIHEACFRLGELYRPDRNPGDPYSAKKFAAVEAAYAVLSDPVRRAAYDRESSTYSEIPPIPPKATYWRPSATSLGVGVCLTLLIASLGYILSGDFLSARKTTAVAPPQPEAAHLSQMRLGKAALDAYAALSKMQAATEIGISYIEYRKQLAETWYLTKAYLDSPETASAPAFAEAIRGAMLAYNRAALIWQAKTEGTNDYTSSFLHITGCPTRREAECERGVELVKSVPDITIFTASDGSQAIPLEDALHQEWQAANTYVSALRAMPR